MPNSATNRFFTGTKKISWQSALVVISWDPLQSFVSGFIRGPKMLMIALRFQMIQAPLGPVNCIDWSGLGYIEVPWAVYSHKAQSQCSPHGVLMLIFVSFYRFFCAGACNGLMTLFPIRQHLLDNNCLAPAHKSQKFVHSCCLWSGFRGGWRAF